MKEIFILLKDDDGTMKSIDEPWGAAVLTEEEAKRYVKEGKCGYSRSYTKVRVFETYEEAVSVIYPPFDYVKYRIETNRKMKLRNS
jgi:hypothetical protein